MFALLILALLSLMAPKAKKRSRKTRSRPGVSKYQQLAGPASSVVHYNGRVRYPSERADTRTDVVVLSDFSTLSSTAGGSIADVFGSDPTPSGGWADWITVYSEYRVLAHEIQYLPINQYSKTTTACVPGVGCIDRRSASALSAMSGAEGRESAVRLSLENPWRMCVKMDNIDEGSFIDVAGPISFSWIKLFFTGLTVSTAYGQIQHLWRIQFKNSI